MDWNSDYLGVDDPIHCFLMLQDLGEENFRFGDSFFQSFNSIYKSDT